MNSHRTFIAAIAMLFALSSCSEVVRGVAQPDSGQVVVEDRAVEDSRVDEDSRATAELIRGEVLVDSLMDYEAAETLDQLIQALAKFMETDRLTAPYLGTDPMSEYTLYESDLAAIGLRFGLGADDVLAAMLTNPEFILWIGEDPEVIYDLSEGGRATAEEFYEDTDGADHVDPVFWEPHLAESHTGPWGDHALGRCLESPRTGELSTISGSGGYVEESRLVDAYVSQAATFAADAEARAAFDEIDQCHLQGAVNLFVESLGWYGYEAGDPADRRIDSYAGAQALNASFDDRDLPIFVAAIQSGRQVSIAITYGSSPEGAYLEASALLELPAD